MERSDRPDLPSLLSADGLPAALLAALVPRGWRERVRARVAPGWTAAQVYARLDAPTQATIVSRFPAEVVHRALVALVAEGVASRRAVRWPADLNTKGRRDMVVDVFWRVQRP